MRSSTSCADRKGPPSSSPSLAPDSRSPSTSRSNARGFPRPRFDTRSSSSPISAISGSPSSPTPAPGRSETPSPLSPAQGMKRLIFDLRNNPGGPLDAAVGVSDLFLAKDQLITSTRGRTPENNTTFRAPGNPGGFDGPLVVLVNQGSASASEIVAGAVQDHDRGLVLGDVTWGKGLVQTVFTVRDTGLALTTARYYTPSGRCIQRDYESFIDYVTHRNGNDDSTGRDLRDRRRTNRSRWRRHHPRYHRREPDPLGVHGPALQRVGVLPLCRGDSGRCAGRGIRRIRRGLRDRRGDC